MSLQKKREEEKAERHDRRRIEILEAAEQLFQSKGIKQTKMTDIAKASELGKATLYFYFKSKDEIVWKLLNKYSYEEYSAGKDYVASLEGNGYEKLTSYFELFTDKLIESYSVTEPSFQYREYMTAMVSEDRLTDEMKVELKKLVERNMSTINTIIGAGIEDGSINDRYSSMDLGSTIGTAFGTYFRYVVGLKASFDDDHMEKAKLDFRNFAHFVLIALKNKEE